MVDAILNRFYKPSKFKKNGDVKDVLVVALPMLLSMSFDTFMTFIDRLFLSKLGPAEMNAALGAGAVQLALTMFFTGITILRMDKRKGPCTLPCLELANDFRHVN